MRAKLIADAPCGAWRLLKPQVGGMPPEGSKSESVPDRQTNLSEKIEKKYNVAQSIANTSKAQREFTVSVC